MSDELPDEIALFAAALELPTDKRSAFLDGACGANGEFRVRIERYLRAHDRGGPLDAPAPQITDFLKEFATLGRIGEQIGPYKLREQIGEGGMGEVYVAEQTQPVRRKVALKIIRPGMATKDVVARFEAERQALAMMDHPNIARVFDGGATDAGQPYFVMELVQGPPITEYCDDRRLTTHQRLELFLSVCRAVQHAHQKGIIHRDLKPSNILVPRIDGEAVPKVIDFGVAKAVGQTLTERTVYTQFSQLVGTPLYMSPEQAEPGVVDIDTRSDVYSLGVLLYELLTGHTPFESESLKQAGFDEMRRMIREDDPPRPSGRLSTLAAGRLSTVADRRAVDPRQLTRTLHGDLDWIVMKCLEKDRNRRYETANGLAMDVRRYLAHEPVDACPPSKFYRLRKYVQRNKGPVLSASLVLLVLVGGIVGTTVGMIRAEQARRSAVAAEFAEAQRAEGERRAKEEAQKRLAQIENATEILAAVFRDLDPESAENEGVTLRALLTQRTNEAAQQLEGEVVGDPLVVARLQHVLGICLQGLGDLKQAEAVLVKAYQTREQLLGADHLDSLATKHRLAMLYRAQAKFTLSETLYKEVLKGRTAKLGPEHPDTLLSQHHLAMLFHSQSDFDAAERLYKEVLRRRTVTLGADHLDTLATQHRLATLYRSQGKFDLAETLCKEVLERRTARLGADHLYTLTSTQLLAALYVDQDKLELAEPLYKEVLDLRRAKLGPDHPDTLGTLHHLGLLYRSMRRPDLSIPYLEEALRLRMAKLDPDHPDTLGTKADLGISYSHAGRWAEAIALLEEVHRKNRGYHLPPRVGDDLLTVYVRAGETTKAIALTTEEVRAAREMFPSDSPALTATIADAGGALLELQAYAQAEPLLRETLSLGDQYLPDSWRTYHARTLLGGALMGQQKFAEAEPLLLLGYAGLREREGQIPPETSMSVTQALERLVHLYDAWGQLDKAAQWRKRLNERANISDGTR
jgi:non-specific serine/threonine protein kinase/serine/threonine-protein kinase